MFIQRTSRFGLAKVLGLVHVFLACVSLPLAVSDHHSATLAGRIGVARRAPSLSSTIIEESSHSDLPTKAHTVFHRRNHHHAANKDENDVPQRLPASSRRQIPDKGPDSHASSRRNENTNININSFTGLDTLNNDEVYKDEISNDQGLDLIIDTGAERVEDDSTVIELEAKLYCSIRFRANVIIVFGQTLKAPNNTLTADQFTSLDLILQALIQKQVYTFNLLPVLEELQGANKDIQFKLVIQALMNIVPAYITSACKFWLDEIENQHVNVEELINSMEQPADFLEGIDPEVIEISKVIATTEELEPFDEASVVTQATLGPIFVNVFYKLKNREIVLSQKLFGAILISLPVGKLNPVLEEYINYIWDLTQDDQIPNWEEVAPEIEYGTPYELVNSVVKKLPSKEDAPDVLKYASRYILLHLKEVPSTSTDEYYTDMQIILNDDENVEIIFSMIDDDLEIPELAQMRDRIINYIKNININDILQGMNKYNYRKPIDVLIALLARIQNRVQDKDISDTVKKLLSILISKKEVDSFTVTVPADVDVVMLLEFINPPDSNPVLSTLIKKIREYLEGDLDLLVALQNFVSKADKSECHHPIQCLLHALKKVVEPGIAEVKKLPSTLVTMIRALVDLIPKAIENSVKCKLNDFITVERPQVPDLVNAALRPISKVLGSSIVPKSLKPTGKQSLLPIPSLKSTDNEETIPKSDSPNPQNSEAVEILLPTHPNSSPHTPKTEDVVSPDDLAVNVIQVKLLEPIRQPINTQEPESTPRPTVKPTPVPHSIQTLNPHDIPSVKPIIELLIAPPISSEKPPVSATPADFLSEQEPPAKNNQDNPSVQIDNEPVLPPNLRYDRPIYVVFPKDNTPPYTLPTKPSGTPNPVITVEFPPMKELLHGFNPNTPFKLDEFPGIPKILDTLKKILGPHFIEEILGEYVDKSKYPTVISLMDKVLDQALKHPIVKLNTRLVSIIRRYLKGIDYLSAIALFPVVIDSKKISSDVIYVTFDPDNPKANSVDSEPPKKIPAGFKTVPFYHPKYSMQQVDTVNPYGTLLPNPDEGDDNPIQELINDDSLQKVLGPEFDPFLYPDRGTLLTTVLWKIIVSKRVKSSPRLFEILSLYLKSIRSVALYSKIPENYGTDFIKLQENNDVNWQPDVANLITALSPARTQQELNTITLIKSFLEMPDLLESLEIDKPSYSTTRGPFLNTIFNAALQSDKTTLDPKILAAIKYYQSRILTNGPGASPIVWIWVEMFIIHKEVPLEEIIELVIDYDDLPNEVMDSYNELMTYLSENPQLLQGNDNFVFDQYDTKGTFLKGLFTHFLTKPDVSPEAKYHLNKIIPYIKLTGNGAEPMNRVVIDDVTNK